MKEEFQSAQWNDFKQRYQGTFGWYGKEDKTDVLVRLDHVDSDELRFVDAKANTYYAHPDKGNIFTFLPVEKGLYNYQNSVVYCRRIPARQWKRGLCSNNTKIITLPLNYAIGIKFDILEGIFAKNKSEEHLVEAYKKGKLVDIAFNTVFGVVSKQLYVFDNVIGSVEKDRFVLGSELFQQEVNDLVRQFDLGVYVDVKK